MSALSQFSRSAAEIPGRLWLVLGLLATGGFAVLLAPPWSPAERFYFFGHGLCHQLPFRSFELGGVQLPLCARCTGIYLGVVTAVAWFVVTGRGTSGQLPRAPILFTMMGAFILMGIDGINSYIYLATVELATANRLPVSAVYEPQNILRIITGGLVGITIGTLLVGVLNFTVWKTPGDRPLIGGFRQLVAMVGAFLVIAFIVNAEPAFLAQPVSLAIGLGMFAVFIGINLVVLLASTGRDAKTVRWSSLGVPLLIALGLATAEMAALSTLRSAFAVNLGLSF